MNNKVKKAFLLRHTEGPLSANGKRLYKEDSYINQQPPLQANRGFLHCFAYSESHWHGKYQYKRSRNWFKDTGFSSEYWSFSFITAGNAEFTCNKIRYHIQAGGIVIMRPETKINLQVGTDGFLKKKTLLLKGPLLEYLCDNGSLAGINHVQPHDSSRLNNIYSAIKTLIVTQDKYWQQEISTQAYALINELSRLAMPHQYPAALRQALDIIDADPYQDYDLDSLSYKCKVSVSTLFRQFKNYLEISPINYIIDRRLEHAKLLLGISSMTLKEIADKCGYKSESFLSRSFKNKFGISPAAFRRSL